MPDLSAYVDFNVALDKSVVIPVVRVTDNGLYPGAVAPTITGVVSVTQPDGLSVVGNFITPDISWNGSALNVEEKELRLSSDSNFQKGLYVVTYTVRATGYDDTVITKSFTINYTAPIPKLKSLFDVFTPLLQYQDDTLYLQDPYTLDNTLRSWFATITTANGTVENINGAGAIFDLSFENDYYDAHYDITLTAVMTYVMEVYPFVTLIDKITATAVDDAYTPATIPVLLTALTTMKEQIENGTYCGCEGCDDCSGCIDYEVFSKSMAIYLLLVERGRSGDAVGLDEYVIQLQKIFICSGILNQTHTNLPITPYDWFNEPVTGVNALTPQRVEFIIGVSSGIHPALMNAGDSVLTIPGQNIDRAAIIVSLDGDPLSEGYTDRSSYDLIWTPSYIRIAFSQPLVNDNAVLVHYWEQQPVTIVGGRGVSGSEYEQFFVRTINVETAVLVNSSGDIFSIENNTYGFTEFYLLSISTVADKYARKGRYLVTNTSGTLVILAVADDIDQNDFGGSLGVAISADSVLDGIKVTVTGVAGKTIDHYGYFKKVTIGI